MRGLTDLERGLMRDVLRVVDVHAYADAPLFEGDELRAIQNLCARGLAHLVPIAGAFVPFATATGRLAYACDTAARGGGLP